MDWEALPGSDLIRRGLADLSAGTESAFTGGATEVLQSWRASTIDIDFMKESSGQ